jgi:hypothetical protein
MIKGTIFSMSTINKAVKVINAMEAVTDLKSL